MFRIGLALWGFDGWVGAFYPPGSRSGEYLDLYVERMNAVEGNTFFYAIPTDDRVTAWADRMPEGFQICPKLHRDITHDGPLLPHKAAAADFIQVMKHFGEHLGPFHLQLPPSYGPDYDDDLQRFLKAWPRQKGPIVAELRHPDWFDAARREQLDSMLRKLGVGRVLLDTRPVYEGPGDPQVDSNRQKPELPLHPERTASRVMVRYIGHPDLARNRSYLEAWAERVDRWLRDDTDIYFFVHCPDERQSPAIARRFQRLLEERDAPVPPLPWNELPDLPRQGDLL